MLGDEEEHDGESVASEADVVMVGRSERNGRGRKGKGKRKGRQSLSAGKTFGVDELVRQTHEIERDKENIHVRRALINNEIEEISHKIEALDAIRAKLEQDLLRLQEEELELDDERALSRCFGGLSLTGLALSGRCPGTARTGGVRQSAFA